MHSAKEPFIENDPELVAQALSLILDTRNYPILVHSNKGKHRWSSSKMTKLTIAELSWDAFGNCKDGVWLAFSTNTTVMPKERERAICRHP